MSIICAGYIRVSTDEQAQQGISLDAQHSRIAAYCQAQGYSPPKFYTDDGKSGKSLDRPGIKQLIKDAQQQQFSHLIVLKLDRLSRRQKDVLFLLEDVFAPAQITFQSVTEPFDTATPFGKASMGMLAVFAQLERETIVERIKIAKREAVAQNRFLGGPIPYGYNYDRQTKTFQPDKIKAVVVKQIFRAYYIDHLPPSEIAERLNEQAILSPRGQKGGWQRLTISRMLKNPFYLGFLNHKTTGSRHHISLIDHIIKEIPTRKAPRTLTASLLSGLLLCRECGSKMRYKAIRQHCYYVCYSQDRGSPTMCRPVRCTCGYKNAAALEAAVLELAAAFLSTLSLGHSAITAPQLAALPPAHCRELLLLLINNIAVSQDNRLYITFKGSSL